MQYLLFVKFCVCVAPRKNRNLRVGKVQKLQQPQPSPLLLRSLSPVPVFPRGKLPFFAVESGLPSPHRRGSHWFPSVPKARVNHSEPPTIRSAPREGRGGDREGMRPSADGPPPPPSAPPPLPSLPTPHPTAPTRGSVFEWHRRPSFSRTHKPDSGPCRPSPGPSTLSCPPTLPGGGGASIPCPRRWCGVPVIPTPACSAQVSLGRVSGPIAGVCRHARARGMPPPCLPTAQGGGFARIQESPTIFYF